MKTIERLKQLLAKATPGPWSGYIQDNDPYGPLVGIIDDHDTPHDVIRCAETSFDVEPSTANVNLMAETRNALPALLAVVEAAEELSDNDDTPEPNCSCHLCPPCNDCVTYAGKREIMATMKAALRALEGGE